MRFGLNKDLGFSEKDRNENIRRIAEVSSACIASGLMECRLAWSAVLLMFVLGCRLRSFLRIRRLLL